MTLSVLHINKRYPPHIGGVETVVRDLARAQASRAGVDVDVLVVADGAEAWEWDGPVRVHRVRGHGTVASNPLSLGILSELRRSARGSPRGGRALHDVWHFHYPFPTGELSLLLERAARRAGAWADTRSARTGASGRKADARIPRPAVVCTYHSDFVPQTSLKRVMAGPYGWLTGRYLGAIDAIIVSSPQLRDHSRSLGPVSDRVRVIPFGIDPADVEPGPGTHATAQQLRARHGLPLMLFVGRLVPYKGVEVLLRALSHVPGHLVIVGEGPLRGSLDALASELGVRERVSFVGNLPREMLTAYFHAADVFVLPSITPNEAFGLVQLEAHACGVPVVSTNLASGVPFVNRHGESGLVVEPGDPIELAAAIGLLLDDTSFRIELGRRARVRYLREFSIEVMTNRVLDLYDHLLSGARHGGGCRPTVGR